MKRKIFAFIGFTSLFLAIVIASAVFAARRAGTYINSDARYPIQAYMGPILDLITNKVEKDSPEKGSTVKSLINNIGFRNLSELHVAKRVDEESYYEKRTVTIESGETLVNRMASLPDRDLEIPSLFPKDSYVLLASFANIPDKINLFVGLLKLPALHNLIGDRGRTGLEEGITKITSVLNEMLLPLLEGEGGAVIFSPDKSREAGDPRFMLVLKIKGKKAAEDLIKAINEKEGEKFKLQGGIKGSGYSLYGNEKKDGYIAVGEEYILVSPERDLLETTVMDLGRRAREKVTGNVFVSADLDRIRDLILAKAPEEEGSEARALFTKFGLMGEIGQVSVTVSHQGDRISAIINGGPNLQNVLTTAYIIALANRLEHRKERRHRHQ